MEQLLAIGAFVGKGNTAEIYRYGSELVVKLYYEKFGSHLALYEQGVLEALNRAGTPLPQVGSVVQYGNRFGLIMEFADGVTLDKILLAQPEIRVSNARLMARLHAGMHTSLTNDLQTQYTAFCDRINNNKSLLGDLTPAVLSCLETLPAGNHVCHGDYHPKNIIAGAEKNVVIDWTNAYRGNPLSDVSLTRLRLLSPYVPKNFPGDPVMFVADKKVIYDVYWQEYSQLTGSTGSDLEMWLLPCAATQLHPSKPVHTEWLVGIIKEQLEKRRVRANDKKPAR